MDENYNRTEASVPERSAVALTSFFACFIVLAVLVAVGGYWYASETGLVKKVSVDSDGYLLDTVSKFDGAVSTGYLVFAASSAADPNEEGLSTYQLGSGEVADFVLPGPFRGFEQVNRNWAVASMLNPGGVSEDFQDWFVPTWINYTAEELGVFDQVTAELERSITMSPDLGYVAYMAQPYRAPEDRGPDAVGDWDIIVINGATGDFQWIEGAIEPTWESNNELLYLTEKGIHRYNALTKTSERIWADATLGDITLSADGRYLVGTTGSRGSIVILYRSSPSKSFSALGTVDAAATVSHPVISPDSQFYAVRTTDTTGLSTFEVRLLDQSAVIESVTPTGYRANSLELFDWADYPVEAFPGS